MAEQTTVETTAATPSAKWGQRKPAAVIFASQYLHAGVQVESSAGGGLNMTGRYEVHTGTSRGLRVAKGLVRAPDAQVNRRFIATARWEGSIVERFDTYFVAEVVNLDNNDDRAIVEFDLRDVATPDRGLCEEGGLFYWSIGYDVRDGGQKSRCSVLTFRRLGLAAGAN